MRAFAFFFPLTDALRGEKRCLMTYPDCLTFSLENGLRVIARPLPSFATVSVGVFIHAGSMLEAPGEEGLCHVMEHMAFKGTLTRSTRRIAEETDLLGGRLNACTTKDHTCYYNKVIAEDLGSTLDLIGDMVLRPALDAGEMSRELSVICEEMAMDEDDPESYVGELLTRAQFEGTPMHHPILGTRRQVLGYRPGDLSAFREKLYTPDRCVIAVCGAFDWQELLGHVRRVFGAWHGTGEERPVPQLDAQDGKTVLVDRDLEQTHLSLGYPGFAFGDARNYALDMLSAILGSSASARLFQRIREELGMAYTVYSYNSPVQGSGSFCLYAAASPDNSAEVLREMQREIQRLARDGISPEEFEQARRMMRITFLMGLEGPSAHMMPLGANLLLLGSVYDPAASLTRLEAVTRDDVVSLCRGLVSHRPSLAAIGRNASALGGVL